MNVTEMKGWFGTLLMDREIQGVFFLSWTEMSE